ncbi:MAG: aldo/keto reductase [Pirellulaceae bacterium]
MSIPTRQLGKTGLEVSILGFGGGHFARKHISVEQSVSLVQRAIDAGVNFMDNAWEYHDGESERRMGLAIEGRREKVVLMTKVCGRDRATAEEHLHQSLARLRTDVIDVWQFHEINYDNDPDWICSADGALEAAEAARKAGKVRFIGFTGHKHPDILLRMLSMGFDWDTCQLPINVADYHFRSFQRLVLPELLERQIGVIGMKSLGGDAQLIRDGGLTPQQCRRYALSQPISTLVTGIESEENLDQDLAIADNFIPLNEQQQADLREQIRPVAGDGRLEWYKTTQYYDAKTHQLQHGFDPASAGQAGTPIE